MTLQRRHALWLVIVAAHVALLGSLAPRHLAAPHAARQTIELTLLRLPKAARVPEAPPRVSRAAPAPRRAPLAPPQPDAPAEAEAPPVPAAEAQTAAAPAPAAPSLLNGEATRRAIHLATRAPLLSERAASASLDPGRENAPQRLGREAASTAHGNCLKGEFPGSGAGLLSLPFWIAAEASGKCKK
jgi:hypothetical protein